MSASQLTSRRTKGPGKKVLERFNNIFLLCCNGLVDRHPGGGPPLLSCHLAGGENWQLFLEAWCETPIYLGASFFVH